MRSPKNVEKADASLNTVLIRREHERTKEKSGRNKEVEFVKCSGESLQRTRIRVVLLRLSRLEWRTSS